MRNKGPRALDSESRLIWDLIDSAEVGAAEGPQESDGAGRRVTVMRPRTLLIGSTALVLVAGAAYGAEALSTNHHDSAGGTAALLQPSAPVSLAGGVVTSPSASPGASRKPTATKSSSTTPSHVITSVITVSPAIPNAPASKSSGVAPTLPAPAGNWLLNVVGGNTAADSTGAHNATATDAWWAQGQGCLFNGTNSQIYTNGPVLSTGPGASFTVSAWVEMTAVPASPATDEVAVSQDADEDSAFALQFTEPAGRWAFSRYPTDSSSPAAASSASADSGPSLSTWTHLVGVYDASTGAEHLYVNGVLQGSATDTTPYSSNGELAIGRGQYDGANAGWFNGAIKKVEVFDEALDAAQVGELS